jgi:hypothetical protein
MCIAVVGAGLLVLFLSLAITQSRVAATKAEIGAIETACEEFKKDMGIYPPDQHWEGKDLPPGTCKPILGVIPPEAGYQVAGDSATIVRDPENGTTRGLVRLLGARFLIHGKTYGPYTRFKVNRLKVPPPSYQGPRWFATGDFWVGAGPIDTSKRFCLDYCPVLILTDCFGNAYVYDCHFPEGRKFLPKPHNEASFDIYNFGPICPKGPDGLISDEDPNNPGDNEDDINNWRDKRESERSNK